jgi:hypothetical protein
LSNDYSKKVILFQAGSSGNFLAALLTTGNIFVLPNTRIDLGQRISSAVFISGEQSSDKRFNDFDSDVCLKNIKTAIMHDQRQVILSHYQQVSELREFESTNWIKKIVPGTNIFGWIKNIVHKKQYVELVDTRSTNFRYQVDGNLMNLKTWYDLNQQDKDVPTNMTVDFGRMYDITYLADLYKSANGSYPDDLRIKFAEEYINKQFPPLGDCDSNSMIDIIEHVKPLDSFDIATALFIYEKNHNTIDSNRLWSIDDLPNTVSGSIEFLIANERNYLIF